MSKIGNNIYREISNFVKKGVEDSIYPRISDVVYGKVNGRVWIPVWLKSHEAVARQIENQVCRDMKNG